MGDAPPDAAASTEDGNKPTSGDTSAAGDEPKTLTLTTKQLAERLERAKPADYDDLKAKAARLDEIEAANKSEIERANDAKAAAERERDEARAEALRLRIAATHNISDPEDIALFLTGTDEETLTKQAQRLAQRSEDRKKNGNVVPKEGTTPREPQEDEMRAFTRRLFESGQTQ